MMNEQQTRVAITGATSFSGYNLANYFSSHNFKVYASFPGFQKEYIDLKRYRLSCLNSKVNISERISSVDNSMLEWIKVTEPQVWVHHFHFMKNWRSAEYDLSEARQNTIEPLKSIFQRLKEVGCLGVVYSSSVAEKPLEQAMIEGKNLKEAGFSPYAISKLESWLEVKKLSLEFGLPIIRLVIPNPIGPGENQDRLIPNLIKHALLEKPYTLNNPNFMTHNIPIEQLMKTYLEAVNLLLQNKIDRQREIVPKTWSLPVLNFCEIINNELFEKRLKWKPCKLDYSPEKINQSDYHYYKTLEVPVEITKHLDLYAVWVQTDKNLDFYLK